MSKTYEILAVKTSTERDESLVGTQVYTSHCACGNYRFTSDGVTFETHCGRTTRRTFAPGHDASLKSLLIDAGAALASWMERARYLHTGEVFVEVLTVKSLKTGKVREVTNRTPVVEKVWDQIDTVEGVARGFGFSYQVSNGIKANLDKQARAGARELKKQAKTEKVAEVEPKVGPTEVKVGRWWYTIESVAGAEVTYTKKDGSQGFTTLDPNRVR